MTDVCILRGFNGKLYFPLTLIINEVELMSNKISILFYPVCIFVVFAHVHIHVCTHVPVHARVPVCVHEKGRG